MEELPPVDQSNEEQPSPNQVPAVRRKVGYAKEPKKFESHSDNFRPNSPVPLQIPADGIQSDEILSECSHIIMLPFISTSLPSLLSIIFALRHLCSLSSFLSAIFSLRHLCSPSSLPLCNIFTCLILALFPYLSPYVLILLHLYFLFIPLLSCLA